MTPNELEATCIAVHLSGLERMILTLPAGTKQKGFPRGELLSVNAAGDKNYSFDPLKLLIWIRKERSKQ